jgi:hypothetical protein
MTVRSKHLTLVGAAGAVALAVGTIAAPAMAASQPTTYACAAPINSPADPTTNVDFDPGTLPTSLVAGQTVKQNPITLVVHLDQTQTGLAQAVGDHVRGTASSTGANGRLPFSVTFPNTAIPGTLGATFDLTGTGSAKIRPTRAGTWTVKLGTMDATLIFSLSGVDTTTLPTSCTAATDGSQILGTIAVSKDKSKTATTAKYNATKNVAKGIAKVRGATYHLPGTGKVKFILRKGTHRIKTLSGKLNRKGIATVKFKNVKKHGKYSITAKFGGDKALKASSGRATFKVS